MRIPETSQSQPCHASNDPIQHTVHLVFLLFALCVRPILPYIAVFLFPSLSSRACARSESRDVVPEVIIYIRLPRKQCTDKQHVLVAKQNIRSALGTWAMLRCAAAAAADDGDGDGAIVCACRCDPVRTPDRSHRALCWENWKFVIAVVYSRNDGDGMQFDRRSTGAQVFAEIAIESASEYCEHKKKKRMQIGHHSPGP